MTPAESDREFLGRLVRMTWVEWAKEQPNPKAHHLEPWENLSEVNREADRRIGLRVAAVSGAVLVRKIEQLEAHVKALREAMPEPEELRSIAASHLDYVAGHILIGMAERIEAAAKKEGGAEK